MICPICGHDVPTGGHFCPGCGTDLLPYTLDNLEAENGGSYFLPKSDLEMPEEPDHAVVEQPVLAPGPDLLTDTVAYQPIRQEREPEPAQQQPAAPKERPKWLGLAIAAVAAVLVIVIEVAAVMHFAAYAQPASVDDPVYTETVPDLGLGGEEE